MKLTNIQLREMIQEEVQKLTEKDWIQKVDKEIEKDGTKGVCTGKKFGGPTCRPGTKRYNLAKTFRKMNEVTAGAEKFADFEEIAQAYRADKTDRKVAQEMAYYIEDVVSPEMENLGLRDTATDSAKGHGLFDWTAREGEDYKNVSIDLYGDGYEVEVYPSSNDDDMQTTTTETLMDAINFARGVLSPQGAGVGAGEDPAQMELPLEEYEKVPGGGDYADEEEEYEVSDGERWDDEEDEAYADDVAGYNEPPDYDLERFGLHRQKGDLREGRLPTKNLKIKIARKKK